MALFAMAYHELYNGAKGTRSGHVGSSVSSMEDTRWVHVAPGTTLQRRVQSLAVVGVSS